MSAPVSAGPNGGLPAAAPQPATATASSTSSPTSSAAAASSSSSSSTRSSDVVIVGSGVAGSLVAYRLALAGFGVLMLEAGPRIKRGNVVENFRNSPTKSDYMTPYPASRHAPHPQYAPPNNYLIEKGSQPYGAQYIRGVGGTTWHWAAATWRLLPSDFRLKTQYGVGRDWPIDYATLEPWYCQAEAALGVSGADDVDVGSPRSQPYPMAALPLSWMDRRFTDVMQANGYHVVPEPAARNSRPYDSRPTCCGNNNCMPICPIGAQYAGVVHAHKAEQAGATLLADAVVYRIEHDAAGAIAAVHYKDAAGASVRVTGRVFVLAANGIEIPKLMLMSTSDKYPHGIGNSSDMVGRNLMDHPGTGVNFLSKEALWPGRGPMEMTSVVNLRDGAFRSQYSAKKLHLSNGSVVADVTTDLILNRKLAGPELERQIRSHSARKLVINAFHEQLPDPANRIVPSREHSDALGIPQPEIHYSIDDYVRRSAAETRRAYAGIAALFDGTEVEFKDDFAPNNHIMGTTIMGNDPANSVVDADCRTHDHPNLYIASSAVMPSAASVNCTLTIAALACRLADHLVQNKKVAA